MDPPEALAETINYKCPAPQSPEWIPRSRAMNNYGDDDCYTTITTDTTAAGCDHDTDRAYDYSYRRYR